MDASAPAVVASKMFTARDDRGNTYQLIRGFPEGGEPFAIVLEVFYEEPRPASRGGRQIAQEEYVRSSAPGVGPEMVSWNKYVEGKHSSGPRQEKLEDVKADWRAILEGSDSLKWLQYGVEMKVPSYLGRGPNLGD
jgi:hypothetical protein